MSFRALALVGGRGPTRMALSSAISMQVGLELNGTHSPGTRMLLKVREGRVRERRVKEGSERIKQLVISIVRPPIM